MGIVNGSLQEGYKNSAWFAANPTLVLLEGQKVNLEQTGTYKLGDGVTQLSALSFLGASSSVAWGGITGTLSNQTDLQTALNNKEPLKGSDDNYVTDAQLVVIQNTSGTNTGDNAANTTSNAYADGKVADSINNGVTTIAPSQNAVFDALENKHMGIMTTHNAYSPVDSVTDYVGLTPPLSPQATAASSLFKIYGNKTIVGAVITWRVANAFSNESVAIYLRNNTDAVDNTITTTLDLSQAAANTSYSQIVTGLNISTSTAKDYTLKRVMPAWGTNGTNLILTVQLITN